MPHLPQLLPDMAQNLQSLGCIARGTPAPIGIGQSNVEGSTLKSDL
jgi:hypothetical protein